MCICCNRYRKHGSCLSLQLARASAWMASLLLRQGLSPQHCCLCVMWWHSAGDSSSLHACVMCRRMPEGGSTLHRQLRLAGEGSERVVLQQERRQCSSRRRPSGRSASKKWRTSLVSDSSLMTAARPAATPTWTPHCCGGGMHAAPLTACGLSAAGAAGSSRAARASASTPARRRSATLWRSSPCSTRSGGQPRIRPRHSVNRSVRLCLPSA